MPGTDTITGTYGLMSEDLYLKKYESTCMYENPSLMNDFNRNELKKEGPIHGFFESDQKRENYDTVGRLALRENGKRNKAEPWLPDGTFLDHQFTEKDPRSLMVDPDMRKHMNQQFARGGYYNYRSDEDFSIPETMIHPEAYRQKIRETQYQAKERMNIFETSQVGWQAGVGISPGLQSKIKSETIQDGKVVATTESVYQNKSGNTTALSNSTPIGWNQTVDHRFQVAQYGQKRGTRGLENADFYKNRGSTQYDQEVNYVVIEDKPIPKPTAEMIVDLSKKRLTELETAAHVQLGCSKQQSMTKKRLTQDHMTREQAKYVEFTGKKSAHAKLDAMQGNKANVQFQGDDNLQRHTIIKPKIVEKIVSANRVMAERDRDDLRESIRQSSKDTGVYAVDRNIKQMDMESLDPTQGKHSVLYDFIRGAEKLVHVYKSTPSKTGNEQELVSGEAYKSKSFKSQHRLKNMNNAKNQQTTDTHFQKMHEFKPHAIGHKGIMGDKTRSRYKNVTDDVGYEKGMTEMDSYRTR